MAQAGLQQFEEMIQAAPKDKYMRLSLGIKVLENGEQVITGEGQSGRRE